MADHDLPPHVLENRRFWDERAEKWVVPGERNWSSEPSWGAFDLPESQLRLLPEDMTGMHAIELGCGTAYVSGWMAMRGAKVVGIDNSEQQLATARRFAAKYGVELTLLHGNAERVPYPDGAFDFVISEYGAATWCDPYRWIPEAHRLLARGGQLSVLTGHPLAQVCTPLSGDKVDAQLHRSYFELHRIDWTEVEVDPGGVEFSLPLSKWLRLFRDTGFELLDYIELQAPPGSESRHNTPGWWAAQWPSEHAFKLRRI